MPVRLGRSGPHFERLLHLAVYRTLLYHLGMDAEHEQPHSPGVDREQDAHFLNRVDTALDRHRKNSEPQPLSVQETVIYTQAPTPGAIAGVGSPATTHAAEPKHDTLPRPPGSAAAPQFFGAGGPMCVALFLVQIVSDLSVPNGTHHQDASI